MGVSINGGIQEWFIAENTIEIMDDKTPIWQITFFLSVNHPVYHLFLWAIYTMIKKKNDGIIGKDANCPSFLG